MPEFRQALRENRYGRVLVAEPLLNEQVLELLKGHMDITQVSDVNPITHVAEVVGYSPSFEALELGAVVPLYNAVFTRKDADSVMLVRFEHVSQYGSSLRT